jgi:predicted metal-dependent hydrolase
MRTASFESAAAQLSLLSNESPAEEWSVRESRRARRLSVRVFTSGRVEVVLPRRTSRRTVEEFLKQHRDWIERKRENARRQAKPEQPFPPSRIELTACAEVLRVHLAGGKGRTRVDVRTPGILAVGGDCAAKDALRRALQRWLMAKAKQTLEPMLADVARELKLGYRKASIRRQRTRWGSCSNRGTISLNCCLLFQPPQVVRYLLIHELAHTAHMNHSRRFWHTVAQHCGDYRRLDRELLEGWRRVPSWAMAD